MCRVAPSQKREDWKKLCDMGRLDEAFRELDMEAARGAFISRDSLYCLLKGCIAQKDVLVGRHVHALSVKCGYQFNCFLGNHIIRMYASQGCLHEAYQVFRKLPTPNVVVWASMMSAHSDYGQPQFAIKLYDEMRRLGTKPNEFLFVTATKACARAFDLDAGMAVHADVIDTGFMGNMVVGNALVDMYAKCGSLANARKVFDKLPSRDLVTWNTIMAAYSQQGLGQEAIDLFESLQQAGLTPDRVTFGSVVKSCGSIGAIQKGRQVHAKICELGLDKHVSIANTLVTMYSESGLIDDARLVFDRLATRDVVTWNAMLAGYTQSGNSRKALDLYASMQEEGVTPDNVTFVSILKACSIGGAIEEGKQIHDKILRKGIEVDNFVGNSLLDMYAKCGCVDDARKVFDKMPLRDVVTWSSMILAYVKRDRGHEAVELYERMEQAGIIPANDITYLGILGACASVGALQHGKRIHALVLERSVDINVLVGSALVDMYVKCGSPEEARHVFDCMPKKNVVTWNALISGYAKGGLGLKALDIYASMRDHLVTPVHATFVSVLNACGSVGALREGKLVHSELVKAGHETDTIIGNALVDMYSKCGSMKDARRVFDRMPTRDGVTWSTIITGYARNGGGEEAIKLYVEMQLYGISPPNEVAFAGLLKSCASTGSMEEGKKVHSQILERGFEANPIVRNTMVDMYGKFGSLDEAQRLFDTSSKRDVIMWNSLIHSYGQHNRLEKALQCFEEMERQGVRPNATSFTCILGACSHAGLVDVGKQYFRKMISDYGMVPKLEHFTCMVDLLGRSGLLAEAEEMLENMPFSHDTVGWTSLLSACKAHGDIQLGSRCFDRLIRMDPQQASAYVLMSGIYTAAGELQKAKEVEILRQRAGAEKKLAKAVLEVGRHVHVFTVGVEGPDTSAKLRSLNLRLQEAGCVPHMDYLLGSLSEQDKEDALCGHAEKLAVAFGLLNTPEGTTLLVNKNLRMCNHCHIGTKIISSIEKREIIVRDAHRVHHFKSGACSCGDKL